MAQKNNRGRNPFKAHDMPTEWSDKFTNSNKEQCKFILDWLNKHEHSINWIAKLARVNYGSFYNCVKGRYGSDPTAMLKKAVDAIHSQESKNTVSHIPFVKTSSSEIAWTACQRARRYSSFAILAGFVGTGKTRSLMEYQKAHENTVLIESDPGMAVQALLDELMLQIDGVSLKNTANQSTKFREVINAIKNTDTLIIIDEAETMTAKSLEHIRRIRDKAHVGIVLSGTEKLNGLIKREHGEFDQIRSRVNFWPKTINGILKDDAEAIIATAFADHDDLDEDITNRLWEYCAGSMRLLVEDLIPAIRDYGLNKGHEMSVELIDSVANQALNLHLKN